MKILVLGNIDSKWVKEYIEYVLLPLGHDVDVGDDCFCKYKAFFADHQIAIHQVYSPGSLVKHVPFFRIVSSALRTVKYNQWCNYDLIINMFVNHRDLLITSRLKSRQTKTVLYYTGSDLLRKSKLEIWLNRVLLRNPTKHVVGSAMLARGFEKKYPKKVSAEIVHFGISAFESIKEYQKKYKKDNKRKVFCIGYNGTCAHNHIAVLESFERLAPEQKDKVELILPMTYGTPPDYLIHVKEKLDSLGIRYHQLTEFMDNEAMAKMWCHIDYFINAQSTDSLSASVLEALYAGAVLVNAEWLDYPEYEMLGIKCLPFSDYEGLFNRIVEIISHEPSGEKYTAKDVLEQNMSWVAAKESWRDLLLQLESN